MTISFKTHILAMTFQNVCHQGTTIKYINVIISPGQTKEGMPYPQALICNSLQYYGMFAHSILKERYHELQQRMASQIHQQGGTPQQPLAPPPPQGIQVG